MNINLNYLLNLIEDKTYYCENAIDRVQRDFISTNKISGGLLSIYNRALSLLKNNDNLIFWTAVFLSNYSQPMAKLEQLMDDILPSLVDLNRLRIKGLPDPKNSIERIKDWISNIRNTIVTDISGLTSNDIVKVYHKDGIEIFQLKTHKAASRLLNSKISIDGERKNRVDWCITQKSNWDDYEEKKITIHLVINHHFPVTDSRHYAALNINQFGEVVEYATAYQYNKSREDYNYLDKIKRQFHPFLQVKDAYHIDADSIYNTINTLRETAEINNLSLRNEDDQENYSSVLNNDVPVLLQYTYNGSVEFRNNGIKLYNCDLTPPDNYILGDAHYGLQRLEIIIKHSDLKSGKNLKIYSVLFSDSKITITDKDSIIKASTFENCEVKLCGKSTIDTSNFRFSIISSNDGKYINTDELGATLSNISDCILDNVIGLNECTLKNNIFRIKAKDLDDYGLDHALSTLKGNIWNGGYLEFLSKRKKATIKYDGKHPEDVINMWKGAELKFNGDFDNIKQEMSKRFNLK